MKLLNDTFASREIQVHGGTVAVMESGEGEPLLMLHAAGMSDVWLPAYQKLAEHYHVIVPHHPGFGSSPQIDTTQTVEDLAYHYDEVVRALGYEAIIVVGVSFGGWIAAEFAVLAPHRIKRLVLIDAIGLRIPGAPILDSFNLNPDELAGALFHDPAVAKAVFPAEPDIELSMKLYRDEMAFVRYAWTPFCSNPKLPQRLHRIAAPTLILWARHDRMVPAAHGERYAQLIPNSRLEFIADAGHAVLIEQPIPSAQAIINFLQAA
jgi:pimeloyl-ACP methyl ester carboxylesterase